jgi:cytochrome c oxidase subunit IV
MAEHGHDPDRAHPGVAEYVEIGVILAVVTAAEVALFYANVPRQITIPALLFLTAIKFTLVVMWYMHLRFDNRLFRQLFIAGLILAAIVYGAVIAIQFFGGQIGGGHV